MKVRSLNVPLIATAIWKVWNRGSSLWHFCYEPHSILANRRPLSGTLEQASDYLGHFKRRKMIINHPQLMRLRNGALEQLAAIERSFARWLFTGARLIALFRSVQLAGSLRLAPR